MAHRTINFCSAVSDHKDPSAILQVFVNHQLVNVVFIMIGVCIYLIIVAFFYALNNLLITSVCCFCVEQLVIFVIEIYAVFYV